MIRNRLTSFLRHYSISLLRHVRDKQQLARANQLVLVYTMGKVGSQSYYNAIKSIKCLVAFHLHSLDLDQIRKNIQQLRNKGMYPDSHNLAAEILEAIANGMPVKIITAVRPPIERNLSAYFEVHDFHLQNQNDFADLNKVIANFQSELWHSYPLSWFDRELNAILGIDVYNHTFDKALKYQKIIRPQFEVLVLRTDLIDIEKEQLISDFLSCSVKLNKQFNRAADKYYSKQYNQFINDIALEEAYVSEMLNSRYTKHFYSQEEISKMRKKWG